MIQRELTFEVKMKDLSLVHYSLHLKVVGLHSYILWIPVYVCG